LGSSWAAAVAGGVHRAGIRDVVYVPDSPLSLVLRAFDGTFPDVRLILATREEEAFGIAAGLYLGGRRPAVMLQSSGVGNSLNAITSLLLPYRIPVLMVVNIRGEPGEWNEAQVPMGRALGPIFAAIGVAHSTVDSAGSAAEAVEAAAAAAFTTRAAVACLLSRGLWDEGVRPRGQTRFT
jgi:sulfopyruvate decarboxylase subunit alpha